MVPKTPFAKQATRFLMPGVEPQVEAHPELHAMRPTRMYHLDRFVRTHGHGLLDQHVFHACTKVVAIGAWRKLGETIKTTSTLVSARWYRAESDTRLITELFEKDFRSCTYTHMHS
jgi:hypothetical protein